MDFSRMQSELPMAMHAGGSRYLGLHHHHAHEQPQQQQHNHGANGREMSPREVEEEAKNRQALAAVPVSTGAGCGGEVRYRECLKNHAAAIGGTATDGCGEFMPAGEDGSLAALRCSACGCHRNFHRKESSDGHGRPLHRHQQLTGDPLSPLHHRGLLVAAAPTRMVMPLSAAHPHPHHHATTSSESDDARQRCDPHQQPAATRKRFRTKFTVEQKARMLGFAEAAGWRLQRLEDAAVQRFCQEVGVKRRVLKVWMHNNKHTLARRCHGDQDQQQLHLPPAGDDGGGLPHLESGRSPAPQQQVQLRLE